jgi:3-phosphoglycerate kinase
MKSLRDLELKGKRVLMRVDFNVPKNILYCLPANHHQPARQKTVETQFILCHDCHTSP